MSDRIDAQRLPIPVGAKHAQRRRDRIFRLRSLNFNRYFLLACIGLLGALAGALISTQPLTVTAGLTSRGDLQIQSFTLAHSIDSQGNDVYVSAYGAMVLSCTPSLLCPGGLIRTGGSTTLNGQDMTGTCTYLSGAPSASCSFTLGGVHLTSTDTRSATGWDRHYSDGKEVKINWANPAFPLPFALGE